ncbi:hypothetical protein ONZ45_g1001 [Pleurotus djamor]|nr:hypothetical protein ONZ45_g1001 [Pleurotus djamor]
MQFTTFVMFGFFAVTFTMSAPLEAQVDQDRPLNNSEGSSFSSAQNSGRGSVRGDGVLAKNSTIESGGALIAGEPISSQIALILIADGTEEMEFTITYDTLVRSGVTCTSAFVPASGAGSSASPPFAKGSRGINIQPDRYFEKAHCEPEHFDALVIPGGAVGASTLSKSTDVQELVREYLKQDKVVGMICAGSLAALTSKLPRQKLTSHPSVKAELEKDFDYSEDPVVVSNNLVTSRGPGTAFPFAFTIVELLRGSEARDEVKAPMIFPPGTPY